MSEKVSAKHIAHGNIKGVKSPLAERLSKDAQRVHTWKLATNLLPLLPLFSARELVVLIGAGHERSNLDALITWVNKHLPEIETPNLAEQVRILLPRLRMDLAAAIERLES